MIQATTPLFSSSDSHEKSIKFSKKEEEQNRTLDGLLYLEEAVRSEVKSGSNSIFSSLEDILLKDNDLDNKMADNNNFEEDQIEVMTNKINDPFPLEEVNIAVKSPINYDDIPAIPNLRLLQQTQSKTKQSLDADVRLDKTSLSETMNHEYEEKSRKIEEGNISNSLHTSSNVNQGK